MVDQSLDNITSKSSARLRADEVKPHRCKNLIAVLENPSDIKNVGTVIRNVDALGVEKTYIIDSRRGLPDDWQNMRTRASLSKTSASAIKWSFVKRFDSTAECIAHLATKRAISIVTSPHIKGHRNEILEDVDYRGITDEAVANAEMCISIPMFGMIEILNLGTTTGIVLYEVTKQRRAYQALYRRAGRRRPIKTTAV